jgi:hypothetical protein
MNLGNNIKKFFIYQKESHDYMMTYYNSYWYAFKDCFWWNKWNVRWILKDWSKECKKVGFEFLFGFTFFWYDGPHFSVGLGFVLVTSSSAPTIKKESNSLNFIRDNWVIRTKKRITEWIDKKM